MSGHDLASTDIGGWNLHVQHKYNFHSGILQKGDGNTIYLKYKPQVNIGEKTRQVTNLDFKTLNVCIMNTGCDYSDGNWRPQRSELYPYRVFQW